jgi:hypothetical protein
MHFYFKIVKSLLLFTPLYTFRTLRAHHQEPFYSCTCSLWLPCDLYRLCSPALLCCYVQFMNDDARNRECEDLTSTWCWWVQDTITFIIDKWLITTGQSRFLWNEPCMAQQGLKPLLTHQFIQLSLIAAESETIQIMNLRPRKWTLQTVHMKTDWITLLLCSAQTYWHLYV